MPGRSALERDVATRLAAAQLPFPVSLPISFCSEGSDGSALSPRAADAEPNRQRTAAVAAPAPVTYPRSTPSALRNPADAARRAARRVAEAKASADAKNRSAYSVQGVRGVGRSVATKPTAYTM
uniref:Uncharacterized protein n=1 Tax=Haptolina ericina TaxID=156174 RepID=A0A7S3ETA1_9EUKA